jgi:hypothetical protein
MTRDLSNLNAQTETVLDERIIILITVHLGGIASLLRCSHCQGIAICSRAQRVTKQFLNLNGVQINLYQFEQWNKSIVIEDWQSKPITEHAAILSQAVQLRWVKIFGDFNTTTYRIAAKLSLSMDKNSTRRNFLSQFRQYLDIEYPCRLFSGCNNPF